MALFRSAAGLQPEMLPSSLEKMKRLGPVTPPLLTWKSLPPLNTMPVGLAGTLPAGGTVTTSDCGTPLPS